MAWMEKEMQLITPEGIVIAIISSVIFAFVMTRLDRNSKKEFK